MASENTLSPVKVHFFPFQLPFDHSDCFMESLRLSLMPPEHLLYKLSTAV